MWLDSAVEVEVDSPNFLAEFRQELLHILGVFILEVKRHRIQFDNNAQNIEKNP